MTPITADVARTRLLALMRGHQWFTPQELATKIDWPESLVLELVRQLRMPKHGRHLIAVKPIGPRKFLYSLVTPEKD